MMCSKEEMLMTDWDEWEKNWKDYYEEVESELLRESLDEFWDSFPIESGCYSNKKKSA